MPRALTNHEINTVKSKICNVAEELLKKNSIRKITVEDITNKSQIAKGTFYHYFESKEMLFYHIFRTRHDEIQNRFLEEIKNIPPNFTPQIFTSVIMNLMHSLNDSFLFDFIQRGDLEILMRALPEVAHQDHFNQDQISMRQLNFLFPHLSEQQLDLFSAAIRLAMVSILFKKEIGENYYESALQLTLKGIITEMMEVNQHD